MLMRVKWEIDIDAESPHAAAVKAREIMLNPESIATVFDITEGSRVVRVDLDLNSETPISSREPR